MNDYSLSHLSDGTLLAGLAALVARERATTAELLAHIAEVDARRLYLPAGFPSMYAYCVGELRLSEQSAFKRIRVARLARQIPAIFAAAADGRLNLSAIVLLAPFLGPDTADELLSAAEHKSNVEVEQLIAERFPEFDVPPTIQALTGPVGTQLSARTVEGPSDRCAPPATELMTTDKTGQLSARTVEAPTQSAQVKPLAPQHFAIQVTIGQSTHDKLRYVQDLLSHQVPSGDLAEVLDRALDAAIGQLEKRKFAATCRPRVRTRASNGRHIPAEVRRTVWKRDGGRCTFTSKSGHRCEATRLLEFDHAHEFALGGEATVSGIRLRCRAHNQYAAECTFGTAFMDRKRKATRVRVTSTPSADVKADLVRALQGLGFRAAEIRGATSLCEGIPDAPLEERVRVALSYFHRPRGGPITAC